MLWILVGVNVGVAETKAGIHLAAIAIGLVTDRTGVASGAEVEFSHNIGSHLELSARYSSGFFHS